MSGFPNQYEGGSPITLGAQVAVPPASTVAFPMVNLTCPFRVPMVIDEIRWQINSAAGPGTLVHLGYAVECALSFGRHTVCQNFPTWLFGPTVQDGWDTGLRTGIGGWMAFYRWLLPRPLFVPAGMSLRPTAMRPGTAIDNIAGNITVDIAYGGRLLEANAQAPQAIDVPYASAFRHPLGQTVSVSTELQLANLTGSQLHIQRFVGRIAAGGGLVFGEMTTDAVTMSMRDGLDRLLVPVGTPFSRTFDLTRRAWTNGQYLDPGGFYRIDLANVPVTAQPEVGLIGWREEAL